MTTHFLHSSETAVTTKEYFIGKAVEYLREDLLKFTEETIIDENNHWPPTFEVLNATKPPEPIIYILTGLLKQHRHVNPEKTTCLVDSYATDLIHGITNGRFITLKTLCPFNGSSDMSINQFGTNIKYCKNKGMQVHCQ